MMDRDYEAQHALHARRADERARLLGTRCMHPVRVHGTKVFPAAAPLWWRRTCTVTCGARAVNGTCAAHAAED